MRAVRVASGSLGVGGLIVMAMGIYFAFLRPALLPEDLRYLGASMAGLQTAAPGLLRWLPRVFGVLGGFLFATGILTVHLAVTRFRREKPLPLAVVAASGAASIGWMAVTNFRIDSDFKWLLLAFVLPWLVAVASSLVDNMRVLKARS